MAGKNDTSLGKRMGIGAGFGFIIALIVVGILYFGGYLTGGQQASHLEGVDFSNYAWYLAVPVVFVLLLVGVTIYMFSKMKIASGKKGNAARTMRGLLLVFSLIGAVVSGIFAGFFVRAYTDTAQTSDIVLQDNTGTGLAAIDLGNYTVLSASIEEYHAKDKGHYNSWRFLSFNDNWRFAIRVNNTAGENLTGVTATLRGYALPKAGQTDYQPVTGLYAPTVQIGAADSGDVNLLSFEGIGRDPRIVHFELIILDSDGEELGKAYIHPKADLSQTAWFMDTAM